MDDNTFQWITQQVMAAILGFISVRQHAEHGYFGGYLIVNHMARPLEFHCTLPVKPTKAQSLLYGPTMDDFVCGEQIAKALITKAKLTPDLVITDTPPVLSASLVCDVPIICINQDDSSESNSLRRPAESVVKCSTFQENKLKFSRNTEANKVESVAAEVMKQLSDRFDVTEPFGRIVEALFEAHPVIKAAA
ncbi:MAG: hypothetical protein U0930_13930 [Pirellulales bacterium]